MGKGDKPGGGHVDDLLAQYLEEDGAEESKASDSKASGSGSGEAEDDENVRALTDELEALLVAAERSQTGPQRQRVTPTEPLHVVQTGSAAHDEFGRDRTGPPTAKRISPEQDEGDEPFARQPTGPFGNRIGSGTEMLPTIAEQEFDAAQTTYRGKRSKPPEDDAARELALDAPTATVLPPGEERVPIVDDEDDEGDDLAPPDDGRQTLPGWSPDEEL